MKLEVGMYVRTKKGTIEKIIDKYEAPYGYKVVVNEDFRFKHYEHKYIKHIVKASHNIIDLLKEGDYVDGCYIQEIKSVKNGVMKCLLDSDYECISTIRNDEISKVLTKECFESIQYEVK